MVRLVDDDEVPLALQAEGGEVRVLGDHVDGGDDALIRLEWPQARHVRFGVVDALVVEQHQELVGLAVDLAQPLDGQRLGREDEHAAGATFVAQAGVDERGFDRLAETDFVGEQHAHRITLDGAAGNVDLVGQPGDPRPQHGGAARTLAELRELEALDAGADDLGVRERERRQALHGSDIADLRDELALDDLFAVLELVDGEAFALGLEPLQDAVLFAAAVAHPLADGDLIPDDDRLGAAGRVLPLFLQAQEAHAHL